MGETILVLGGSRSGKSRLAARHDDNVVAGSNGARLYGEARISPQGAIGQHVVEQHAVHTPEQQVAVGMHVVVVRNRANAMGPLRLEQRRVRNRAREGRDRMSFEIRQAAEPIAIPAPSFSMARRTYPPPGQRITAVSVAIAAGAG